MLRSQNAECTQFENQQANRKTTRYQLTWADVAIRAGLAVVKGMKEGVKTKQTADERRVATILAMRHYKRAQAFIRASAEGSFPNPVCGKPR